LGHAECEDDADFVKQFMLMETRELDRRDVRRRPGAVMSEGIWRFLACPMRTLRIGINGD